MFNKLGRMLGVYWTLDDVQEMTDRAKNPSRERVTEFFYPLTCVIEPRMPDILKKTAGSKYGIKAPKWARQGEFEDMFGWGAEQFLQFVGGMVEPRAPTGHKAL